MMLLSNLTLICHPAPLAVLEKQGNSCPAAAAGLAPILSPQLTNNLSSKGAQVYFNTSYLGSTWSDKGSCMSDSH